MSDRGVLVFFCRGCRRETPGVRWLVYDSVDCRRIYVQGADRMETVSCDT